MTIRNRFFNGKNNGRRRDFAGTVDGSSWLGRSAILLLLILLSSAILAQDDFGIPSLIPYEMFNPCNSAPPSGGQVHFNVDILDTMNEDLAIPMPITSSRIFISTDAMASWNNYALSLIGTRGYEQTYQNVWTATGNFNYYFQFVTDSTVSTESPKYPGSGFATPSYLVNIHDDPADDDTPIIVDGDTYNWTNTDLRNFKMSYSNTRLYFQMTTQGGLNFSHSYVIRTCGSWITWDQHVNFYHLYAAPIINPNAPYPDSIFYAVVYGNMDVSIFGMGITITPGVYKIVTPGPDATITDYLDAYTMISTSSNFWYSTSGNTVSMYFDRSVLTSDPDFGDFPDDDGFVTGCGIVTLALWSKACGSIPYVDIPDTFYYAVHDFSRNTVFYMRTGQDNVGANTPFTLASPVSSAWEDSLRLSILYTDPDNNLPISTQLEIGGCYPFIYDMYSYDHKYDDGSTFQYTVPMETPHKVPYRLIFSDGMSTTTTAWDTLNTGITAIDVTVNNSTDVDIDIADMECNTTYHISGSDTIAVQNRSRVPVDYGIRVVSITDGSNTADVCDAPDPGCFAVRAIFADSYPSLTRFDDSANRLSGIMQWADDVKFGGGGYNVLPKCYNSVLTTPAQQAEKLYLKIMSPLYMSMDDDWDLTITIEVTARAHLV